MFAVRWSRSRAPEAPVLHRFFRCVRLHGARAGARGILGGRDLRSRARQPQGARRDQSPRRRPRRTRIGGAAGRHPPARRPRRPKGASCPRRTGSGSRSSASPPTPWRARLAALRPRRWRARGECGTARGRSSKRRPTWNVRSPWTGPPTCVRWGPCGWRRRSCTKGNRQPRCGCSIPPRTRIRGSARSEHTFERDTNRAVRASNRAESANLWDDRPMRWILPSARRMRRLWSRDRRGGYLSAVGTTRDEHLKLDEAFSQCAGAWVAVERRSGRVVASKETPYDLSAYLKTKGIRGVDIVRAPNTSESEVVGFG